MRFSHTAIPKQSNERKGYFGASLKPGDSIVIYATMPVAEIIGTVKVVKRESLAVDRLWQASKQGRLAKVSREQFETYYTNQESGIGVWVGAAELWLSSDRTRADFAKTGAIAGSLRSKFNNWPMNKYRLSIAFNVTS
jgi:predicted transcriptional regulator